MSEFVEKEFELEGSIAFQDRYDKGTKKAIRMLTKDIQTKNDLEHFISKLDWNDDSIEMKLVISMRKDGYKWHGFRIGENEITYDRINYWNHSDEIKINQVALEAEKAGFKIVLKNDDFLRVIFESLEDVNKFYSLVVAIE